MQGFTSESHFPVESGKDLERYPSLSAGVGVILIRGGYQVEKFVPLLRAPQKTKAAVVSCLDFAA